MRSRGARYVASATTLWSRNRRCAWRCQSATLSAHTSTASAALIPASRCSSRSASVATSASVTRPSKASATAPARRATPSRRSAHSAMRSAEGRRRKIPEPR